MLIPRVLASAAITSLLTSCISYSSMQPADTLAPGSTSAYSAAVAQKLTNTKKTTAAEKTSMGADGIFFYEVGGRLGVVKDIDIGLRVILEPGIVSTLSDVKFQLVRSPTYSMSTGLGVSFMSLNGSLNEDTTNISLFETHIPLYTTFHITKNVDWSFTPKLIYRIVAETGGYAIAGASTGFFLGGRTRFGIEYSAFQNTTNKVIVQQLAAGIILGYPNVTSAKNTEKLR